jgi:hypothetical protein
VLTSLMLLAGLTGSPLMGLPEGFRAQCKSDSYAEVHLLAAPGKDSRLLTGFDPDGNTTIDLRKMGGQYMVETSGADSSDSAQEGPDWKIVVLKEQPGNLVISLSTSRFGASTAIYHLRYQNHIGAMTVSTVSYYGTLEIENTTLAYFHCATTL